MFGDEQNGYVLSYMFKIRDSQARGMLRFSFWGRTNKDLLNPARSDFTLLCSS